MRRARGRPALPVRGTQALQARRHYRHARHCGRATRCSRGHCRQTRKALQACKRAIDIAADEPEDQAIAKALQLSDEVFDTNDAREGARAFFHKEKPAFTHS